DDPGVASVEANHLVNGVGRGRVAAPELGNEPELYGIFTWGASGAPGRPRGYDSPAFERDFDTNPRPPPTVPRAAPAAGGPDAFASARWGLDVLFEMAAVGVDGVNMHTFPGAAYELFTFRQVRGRWQAVVAPEYYGLEAFAQAAPAGSRLLSVPPSPRRNTHL